MLLTTLELEYVKEFLQPLLVDLLPVHKYRKCNILGHIEHRDEIVELIYKTHLSAAENSQLFVIL